MPTPAKAGTRVTNTDVRSSGRELIQVQDERKRDAVDDHVLHVRS